MQKNVGATEWIKDENENHFKNGNKGQKGLTKMFEKFCWEKTKRKLTCFNFVVGKGLTLVTLVGRTLKVTLKWLQGCQ
jgi:hypothetical protein